MTLSKQHSQNSDSITPRQAAERLRLLLSWQETLAMADASKRGSFGRMRKQAARETERLRERVRQEVERLGAELQKVFSADQAHPGNCVIGEKLEKLRHTIRQFNQVLKAQRADELGGIVELPLDHYPVELGLGRDAPFQLEREDFITLAVAAGIIVISCFSIAWYNLWREDVSFNIDRPSTNQVAIIFRNDSSFDVNLYGPWPDGDAGLERHSYGVRLYCRTAEMESFQDCTNLRDAWGYQGQVISSVKPVQVESGVSVTIYLHVPTLEKAYDDPIKDIRITCGNRRNQDAKVFELALGE